MKAWLPMKMSFSFQPGTNYMRHNPEDSPFKFPIETIHYGNNHSERNDTQHEP